MDRRLLNHYNRELQHLRGTAGDFAREFPKVASRLALDDFACGDPYVERLLEGFAFLSARVQLKLEDEFPQFTQSVLETVYPHYLSPIPSMAVVSMDFEKAQGGLEDGFPIPRGTVLRSIIGKENRTACEYRSGQPVMLWPLNVVRGEYLIRELEGIKPPPAARPAKAGIRITLEIPGNQPLSDLQLDSLTFYLRGSEELPMQIYEQIFAHGTQVLVQPAEKPLKWQTLLPAENIQAVGFADDEALLPAVARTFRGYRLLQEYFAFPQRFLFFRLTGLQEAVKQCAHNRMDIVILLDQEESELEGRVDETNFLLNCTPVINLFPKRADMIQLSDKFAEYHVVPNRTRPLDFEVYQVQKVTGYGLRAEDKQEFLPFYAATDADEGTGGAYFTVNRISRMLSDREKRLGRRSSYGGSELFISIVDSAAAPYSSDLRRLAIETLCTNRDLPIQMAVGRGKTDFNLDISSPVESVRCVAGPTTPRPSNAVGDISWRIISHLSLNYLSLIDGRDGQGAAAIRSMLRLYCDNRDMQTRKQIEGVLSLSSRPITRRISDHGQIAFVRGLEITLEFEELAFAGTGVFILGAVMNIFFSNYVAINSFTETVIKTRERGEIMRWPTKLGNKHLI
ncbi:MAG: type VI secretion system baseplate subunit TssF [Deltaproteobacteria bacterium]|nr:MAG: type VI secretion system baseplate subunit TssF [Deltaproteobacteria bacterium]